jgi:hypothetical protein
LIVEKNVEIKMKKLFVLGMVWENSKDRGLKRAQRNMRRIRRFRRFLTYGLILIAYNWTLANLQILKKWAELMVK